jgi:hypothetical protein
VQHHPESTGKQNKDSSHLVKMKLRSLLGAIASCFLPLVTHAAPGSGVVEARQATNRLVFAHFMVTLSSDMSIC